MGPRLLTARHGTASRGELTRLLQGAAVDLLVDMRPGAAGCLNYDRG